MVLRGEVPPQQPYGGEGHLSRGQPVEDHREAAAGPGGLDPVASRVLRQPKGLGAITEKGPVALSGVDGRARIEHGQMSHELDRCLALPARERVEAREEIPIRQSGCGGEDVRVHGPHVSRRISGSGQGPGRAQERRSAVRSAAREDLGLKGTGRRVSGIHTAVVDQASGRSPLRT